MLTNDGLMGLSPVSWALDSANLVGQELGQHRLPPEAMDFWTFQAGAPRADVSRLLPAYISCNSQPPNGALAHFGKETRFLLLPNLYFTRAV